MIFTFTITFPKETDTDAESLSNDLEENGLGNYTTDVKEIVDKNRKFGLRKTHWYIITDKKSRKISSTYRQRQARRDEKRAGGQTLVKAHLQIFYPIKVARISSQISLTCGATAGFF